jgi:AcrR family transcriptional regulator
MIDAAPGEAVAAKPRSSGKRERLVAAAIELLHRQGVERTTLADVATVAGVPPGNVYYYFKRKDDIIAAVVEAHAAQIKHILATIDARYSYPKERLCAFVHELTGHNELVVRSGCPLGSLCVELDKRGGEPGPVASDLMRLPVQWAEVQFRALGRADARDLAFDLIALYEGSAVLANTMRDPDVLVGAGQRLHRWINAL